MNENFYDGKLFSMIKVYIIFVLEMYTLLHWLI